MPSESDLRRQEQRVNVLREVNAGDTLGPPQDDDPARMRKFELSRKRFPAALIDHMITEKLIAADDERGVIITTAGERFLHRYR